MKIVGVYLHIIADTLGSVGVIISSILIEWKGWIVADPICSLCISILIFVGVLPLLQSSSSVLLQSIPNSLEPKIESALNHVKQKFFKFSFHAFFSKKNSIFFSIFII